jgi:hypothetical protein
VGNYGISEADLALHRAGLKRRDVQPQLKAKTDEELEAEGITPALREPYYKRNGSLIRETTHRIQWSECLDPNCPLAWEGTPSMGASAIHTENTGHPTRQHYEAEYVMIPNPLHPYTKLVEYSNEVAQRDEQGMQAGMPVTNPDIAPPTRKRRPADREAQVRGRQPQMGKLRVQRADLPHPDDLDEI